MHKSSLLREGSYSTAWVGSFCAQANAWWGVGSGDGQDDAHRSGLIARYCGAPPKRVLELGAGNGRSAVAVANLGYIVVAIDMDEARSAHARSLAASVNEGSLTVVTGDFYTAQIPTGYDVVCYWDGFGIGSDEDQRRLLRRISHEWLAPSGCVLIDVANPYWAVHNDGKIQRLAPVPGEPGSVEMLRKWHFDARASRWIDEWEPVGDPGSALSQAVRCYSMSDLNLLIEGTDLALSSVEVAGQTIDTDCGRVTLDNGLKESYSYLAKLTRV